MHRIGSFEPETRRCLTVFEMIVKGMSLNRDSLWITKVDQDSQVWSGRRAQDTGVVQTLGHAPQEGYTVHCEAEKQHSNKGIEIGTGVIDDK